MLAGLQGQKRAIMPRQWLDERADPRDVRLMHLALANRGVFSSTRQLYVVPTVWTAETEQRFVTAFDAALGVVAASRAARESARVL